MAISEESKHRLYGRLEEVLGHDEATTFMEMVRPQGWDDVATKADVVAVKADVVALKADLVALEERLEARLEARIATAINQALTTQTRTLIVSNASMLAGVAAIAAVLAR